MNPADLLTGAFGIQRMSDGSERIMPVGLKRVMKIGFTTGFLLANYLSYLFLGPGPTNFILPTNLNANRLVFLTFLIHLVYHQTGVEEFQNLDKKLGLKWFYVPDRDRELLTSDAV